MTATIDVEKEKMVMVTLVIIIIVRIHNPHLVMVSGCACVGGRACCRGGLVSSTHVDAVVSLFMMPAPSGTNDDTGDADSRAVVIALCSRTDGADGDREKHDGCDHD